MAVLNKRGYSNESYDVFRFDMVPPLIERLDPVTQGSEFKTRSCF